MNYEQTLAYLFERLPMFTRIGKAAFKKDLTNTLALCKLLNEPQHKFRSVHVAGTNGKGSTSHMLASVLQEAGYKTGLYTSPHLKDFRERIRINGEMIGQEFVVDFVAQYKDHFEQIEPSFFEWTVALCFHYFAIQQVDIAIIETGLGGRLDSTNVITPELSVITNIGWDHTDMLGDTLELIAAEKAGIIKPNIPVVIGESAPESMPVFVKRAAGLNAPLHFADQEIKALHFHTLPDGVACDLEASGYTQPEHIVCDLGGIYQQRNLVTVYAALQQLRQSGFGISDAHIRNGLSKVKSNTGLMGRWQVLSRQPLTVCDTGHNTNGLSYVLEQIRMQRFKRLHMVIGVVRDKDISNILDLLPKDAVYYFCHAAIPRALPSDELQQQAFLHGLKGESYGSVANAFAAAQKNASADDMIFIGGSTFVVAEAL